MSFFNCLNYVCLYWSERHVHSSLVYIAVALLLQLLVGLGSSACVVYHLPQDLWYHVLSDDVLLVGCSTSCGSFVLIM